MIVLFAAIVVMMTITILLGGGNGFLQALSITNVGVFLSKVAIGFVVLAVMIWIGVRALLNWKHERKED
jgi:large-conductance mechanosensitive channel